MASGRGLPISGRIFKVTSIFTASVNQYPTGCSWSQVDRNKKYLIVLLNYQELLYIKIEPLIILRHDQLIPCEDKSQYPTIEQYS